MSLLVRNGILIIRPGINLFDDNAHEQKTDGKAYHGYLFLVFLLYNNKDTLYRNLLSSASGSDLCHHEAYILVECMNSPKNFILKHLLNSWNLHDHPPDVVIYLVKENYKRIFNIPTFIELGSSISRSILTMSLRFSG